MNIELNQEICDFLEDYLRERLDGCTVYVSNFGSTSFMKNSNTIIISVGNPDPVSNGAYFDNRRMYVEFNLEDMTVSYTYIDLAKYEYEVGVILVPCAIFNIDNLAAALSDAIDSIEDAAQHQLNNKIFDALVEYNSKITPCQAK